MGFKCPVCLKDFGRDKEKWQEHTKIEHLGAGNDIIKTLEKITANKRDSVADLEK